MGSRRSQSGDFPTALGRALPQPLGRPNWSRARCEDGELSDTDPIPQPCTARGQEMERSGMEE